MKRYEQFPHTADIGVRVYGRDEKELFENAAFALFDVIGDLEGMKTSVTEEFIVNAPSKEELLVSWLDDLLYVFYTKSILFSEFRVYELSGTTLKARAEGRSVSANRNRLKSEVKAVTYSDLAIKKSDDGYVVEIIFDV